MSLMLRPILAFALLLGAGLAHADDDGCEGHAAAIVAHAYPTAKAAGGGSYQLDGATFGITGDATPDHPMMCRAWPAHPELLLVAVPLTTSSSEDGSEGDIELLVLDRANLKVRQRLRVPNLLLEDAIRISDIAIDTARYQLAPGQLAFGLRITHNGSSRPNPFGEVDLSLYAIERDALRTVLPGVVVSMSQGEWDTRCAGDFTDTSRTLSMAPASHNGYADILLSEKVAARKMTLGKDDQCNDQPAPLVRKSYTLTYDGKSYVVPKELRPLE